MNIITRNTDYAIRALCFSAKSGVKIVSVSDLVRELKIPKPFLRAILQKLNKKRILKSYKGKGGGFSLERSPDKIKLLDLMRVFQGDFKLQDHFLKKGACPNIKTCILKKRLDKIERYVGLELNSITISTLIKDI